MSWALKETFNFCPKGAPSYSSKRPVQAALLHFTIAAR
jgi:hypothetical protein